MKALILISDGSEEVEAVTAVDVLRRAGVEVVLAAVKESPHIMCSRHVNLMADAVAGELKSVAGHFDAIVLPGGLKGAQTFAEVNWEWGGIPDGLDIG